MFDYLKIYVGETVNREEILEKLVAYDYRSSKMVAVEGDFSSRGGIIDVYPITFECPIRIELHGDKVESIRSFDVISGAMVSEHTIVIILSTKGIKSAHLKAPYYGFGEEIPIHNFVDIKAGDYVVHINHGIGRYLGIKKLRHEHGYKDHIVIEYADGDKLYVPCDQLYMVQKYIGFEGHAPKLYKLGSQLWEKVKAKARDGIYILANEMLELQAMRAALEGYRFSRDTEWQRELEKSFIYKETPDQTRTTLEVKRDMESSKPMDRLVCGDVGYGKTEVALRATFKAVMDNKQVAILVPTTILAEQHYNTFTNRLKDYPVVVEMLSRFRTDRQQELIVKGLREGVVDVVIGTHRLLSPDIKFKDLGLVIIDEEQRFGVKHKEKLKQLRLLVDVLTLTATPIPRTLYMSLMGTRDMSIINTSPAGRLPIETTVCEFDEHILKKAILREMNRGGQTYFVHNRVQGIEKVCERLAKIIPEAQIGIGHGQMKEKNLEEVMLRFINHQIDVLVSTTIIESGIDIPNANTLIVNNADQFGLADLYQLRGRVGRFMNKAYAYFLIPKDFVVTSDSHRRLHALEKFTELGSGFKIAMEDLQIRGAGNLLGSEQHGHIMAVGFDLYCRLLREAVNSLKSKDSLSS